MELQQTIAESVSISGQGLFSGDQVKTTFHPAPDNHGVVFVRSDLNGAQIPALVNNVVKAPRRTMLKSGEATVETCEHCLSAIAALQIDNVVIELNAPELPALDGSAKPYVDLLQRVGVKANGARRRRMVLTDPVIVHEGDALITALPCNEPMMQVVFDLDYGQGSYIGRQLKVFNFSNGEFIDQIAPARTYVLESEARALHAAGVGKHLTAEDVLVITPKGPMGNNTLRFPDEPVRHKIVDLIGDLCLLGAPIQARIIAYKSSHRLNHALVRKLLKQFEDQHRHDLLKHRSVLDIRRLMRILPHRYPMLLVDRVVELDGDRRAVGIKNVTVNEPFFQGHYPGTPIMPGVLVVEAMGQLSGVLIAQKLEHTGKLAVLLSLDRVKLRKPVTPGDQLILEAVAVRVRSRIAHMRCRAYVGDELAAEAEVKFMLVDDEKE